MKKMIAFCLLGIVVLLCMACPFDNVDVNTVTVSGSSKTITEKLDRTTTYGINFNGLNFASNNITINIEPVTSSELARVDVTYSEELDNYGFDVTIENETILIEANSAYVYDIDTFKMIIYAVFDDIGMGGGGYKALVDATNVSRLDIISDGSVACTISSLVADKLDITTNGSSSIILLGTVDISVIDTNGSSNISAKDLICDRATINTSGVSSIVVSVRTRLRADTAGSSYIKYYGSPLVSADTSGTSYLTQVSPNLP